MRIGNGIEGCEIRHGGFYGHLKGDVETLFAVLRLPVQVEFIGALSPVILVLSSVWILRWN